MKTILIIEDNDHVREALAATLYRHLDGYNILTAANGKEGVEILRNFDTDLVLTDLQMPIMDGYGVIEYKNKNLPHIPLIVMTADNATEVKAKLNALGVSQYVQKPFDFDKLAGAILTKLAGKSNGIVM